MIFIWPINSNISVWIREVLWVIDKISYIKFWKANKRLVYIELKLISWVSHQSHLDKNTTSGTGVVGSSTALMGSVF